MNLLKVTQETVQRQWNWMLIPKLVTPALLVTLIVLVIRLTTFISNIDARSFSSIESRVKTEMYVESAMTPVQVHKMLNRVEDLEVAQVEAVDDRKEIKAALERIEDNLKKNQ